MTICGGSAYPVAVPNHALDAIDEAVGPTRDLVSNLSVSSWLKLGVLTLFVGGFGSVSFSANLPSEVVGALPAGASTPPDLGRALGTGGLVVSVAVALSLFFLARSMLEFVFYEALRDGTVDVRGALGRWWLHGVQVWVLRAVIAVTLLGGGSALASAVAADGVVVAGASPRLLVLTTVACSFGTYAVVAGFTTRFVVPVMLIRGDGVLDAWSRFLRTVRGRPGQYAWYLLVAPFVRFVADVLALSAAVLLAVLLAVPVALFVIPALVVVRVEPRLALSPPLIMLTTGLSAGYVLAVVLCALLARLPFVAYVRYYAVVVLGGTDPALDLFAPRAPGEE